jgi:hypothetical protein
MARSSRHTPLLIIALVLGASLLFAVPAFANTLKVVQELPTGREPHSIAAADIDDDGLTDIAFTNFLDATVRVLYQQPTGRFDVSDGETFTLSGTWPDPVSAVPHLPSGIAVADVDGDGSLDIAVGDAATQFIYLWRQSPGVGSWVEPKAVDTTTQAYPIHPAYGWLDPDMWAFDPLVADGSPMGVHPWSAGYQLDAADVYPEDATPTAEIAAVNLYGSDGTDSDAGAIHLAEWRNDRLESGFVAAPSTLTAGALLPSEFGPQNPLAVAIGDFNTDGLPDLLTAGIKDGTVNYATRLPRTDWRLLELNDIVGPAMPVRATAGDLNSDGRNDVVVTGRSGFGSWSSILQDDLGRLGGFPHVVETRESTGDPVGVRIADITGDGLDDVIMANADFDETTGSVAVVPQMPWPDRQRRAPLSYERAFDAGRYPQDVAVADFDTADDVTGPFGRPMNEVVVLNSNSNTLMFFDQVPPDPPDIEIEGGSGSPLRRAKVTARAVERSILWLSDTSPVIRFAESGPDDLNVMKGYYWLLDTSGSTEPTPGVVPPTAPWTFVNTSTPVMLSNLTSGTYWLHVVSVDQSDNMGTSVGHYQINIDVTPPVCGVPSDGYAGTWSVADVRNVTWPVATDTQSGPRDYVYSVDGGDETITTELSALVTGLADGEHVFSLKARDNANPPNISSTQSLIMRVDQGLPTVSITSPADSALVASAFRAIATASDDAGIAKVEFYLNGVLKATDTASPYSQIISTTGLSSGSYSLLARAHDMYGHTSDDAQVVKVDTIPPKILNVSLAPSPFFPIKRDGYKDNLYIKFWLSENSKIKLSVRNRTGSVAGYRYHNLLKGSRTLVWNGTLINKSGSVFKAPVGTYYVTLTAWDAAGNVKSTRAYPVRIQRYIIVVLSGSRIRLVEH